MTDTTPVIDVKGLGNYLGGNWVHRGLDFTVNRKEIIGIIGGSGSGKTTLLRSILMLLEPTEGVVKVFDQDVWHCSEAQGQAIRHRWGMLFQKSALFTSLTVLENIMFPMQEFTRLPKSFLAEIALLKICMVGLPASSAHKFPAELSGGMLKRAATARAIALDPELLFLDEPTSGLDPKSAEAMDNLALRLRDSLNMTLVFVSHDVESMRRIADRVAFIGDGKVLAMQPLDQLMENPHPQIQAYFSSAT